jgi:hypothetical protein
MDISGTLHFYSGQDKELFFVFDDDVAQPLYRRPEFDIEDLNSRRVYISVGRDRFIHRRTLSFSRKQTEIKVSLCSRSTKDDLGALTTLYDWFSSRGRPHPRPFAVLGTLRRAQFGEESVWELWMTEPVGLIVPPGLARRRKTAPPERRSYEHRRRYIQRDLEAAGRAAERLAFELARLDYPSPDYSCLWRQEFLDSERIEIRKMGVLDDIDVWNIPQGIPEVFIEVNSQKVLRRGADPMFYFSVGEWRSYERAKAAGVPYQVWLFQYLGLGDFKTAPHKVALIVFDELSDDWLNPNGYLITPGAGSGKQYYLT